MITLNDGNIHVTSSDDGINIAGGAGGSSIGGRPCQIPFNRSGDDHLDIHGGYIAIYAAGDGIDVNGGTYTAGTELGSFTLT